MSPSPPGKRGPRPDRARDRVVLKLHNRGTPPTKIADQLGCSVPYVYKVLHRHDVFRAEPERRPLMGAERVIYRLHRAGLGVTLLAHLLRVSPLAIYKSLERHRRMQQRDTGQIPIRRSNSMSLTTSNHAGDNRL
jgi:hypothetical protein